MFINVYFCICKKEKKHLLFYLTCSQWKQTLMTGKYMIGKLTTRQGKMDVSTSGGAGVQKKGFIELVFKEVRSHVNISSIKCAQTEILICA